jgi:hypothetical protein
MRSVLSPLVCALTLLVAAAVTAQQPFVTDDADTTPKHHFHFEFSDELDLLQRSSFPNLKQSTADFELNYGLFDRVEIGIEAPVVTIFSGAGTTPRTVSGIGDANLGLKYNFLRESDKPCRLALAVVITLKLPTGSVRRQLGSGLADLHVNGVLQKSLTGKTKLRLNGGILIAGTETIGVVGIKTRGTVFTGGGSLVRQFSPKLQLGIELTTALLKNLQLGKGQLQALAGGNFQFRKNMSLDFAIIGGKFAASPRAGIKLGTSIDF